MFLLHEYYKRPCYTPNQPNHCQFIIIKQQCYGPQLTVAFEQNKSQTHPKQSFKGDPQGFPQGNFFNHLFPTQTYPKESSTTQDFTNLVSYTHMKITCTRICILSPNPQPTAVILLPLLVWERGKFDQPCSTLQDQLRQSKLIISCFESLNT